MRCRIRPGDLVMSSSGNERPMKIWPALIGIGYLLAPGPVQAGPPFVTDDPEPPPPGGWEINVPFIIERTPGTTEMDAPLFDLNYGLPDIQLKLEVPIKIVHEDSNGTLAGAGDLLIGVKWRFFYSEKSQLQLGIYPQSNFSARHSGPSCSAIRRKSVAAIPSWRSTSAALEVERAPQPALLRWTRHCRRYDRDGLS